MVCTLYRMFFVNEMALLQWFIDNNLMNRYRAYCNDETSKSPIYNDPKHRINGNIETYIDDCFHNSSRQIDHRYTIEAMQWFILYWMTFDEDFTLSMTEGIHTDKRTDLLNEIARVRDIWLTGKDFTYTSFPWEKKEDHLFYNDNYKKYKNGITRIDSKYLTLTDMIRYMRNVVILL
jgi:hypothetical protein